MSQTQSSKSDRKISNFYLVLLLGALSTVSPFSIDMYLPAFGGLAEEMHSSVARVGLSVSSYFVGLATGQIFYGPLLDRFGRKPPLCIGLGLYLLATIGCIQSTSIEALITFRFFQALGGCVAQVGATAMVRDFFPARESAKIFALLILILGVSPLLAPSVGSLVIVSFGWKAVFELLGFIVLLVLLAVIFYLPEGHQPDTSVILRPMPIARGFRDILRVPQFTVYTFAGSLSFAGLFAYVSGSPAVFMEFYHLGANAYGLVFAGLSVAFIGGSQVNLWLGRFHSNAKIFRTSISTQCFASLIFVVSAWQHWLNLWSTLGFLFVILGCLGIASPNATALALAPFSKNVGRASALFGFLQMGIGAVASTLTGMLDFPGPLPTVAAMTVSAMLGGGILLWGESRVGEIIVSDDSAVVMH